MWIASVLAALAAAIAVHAIASRALPRVNRVLSFLVLGSVIAAVLFVPLGARYGAFAPQTIAALVAYAFLCELYLWLFTMVLGSVSATILVTLSKRALSEAELADLYDSRRMVAQRIDRLVGAGLLAEDGAGLRASVRGVRLLRTLDGLRRFFRHDSHVA